MKEGKSASRLVIGLVAGALVGTAIGLLVAPQPGKASREAVGDKAGRYISQLRESWEKRKISSDEQVEANGHRKVSA